MTTDTRAGHQWRSIMSFDPVTLQALPGTWTVAPVFRGGGILRGMLLTDGSTGLRAIVNVYDAVLDNPISAPGVVGVTPAPSFGRALFIADPPGAGLNPGFGSVTDLQLRFTDGLVIVVRSTSFTTVCMIFDADESS